MAEFLKSADPVTLTFALAYVSAYLGSFWLSRVVGDLRSIQKAALYGIARRFDARELSDLIDYLLKERAQLLLPARRKNNLLQASSALFFLNSFLTVFYDPLSRRLPTTVVSLVSADLMYSTFSALLLLCCVLLYFEYGYWIEFKKLKDENLSGAGKGVKIKADA